MPSLVVAAVQTNSQADVSQNLKQCAEGVQKAAEKGAKLIFLPENFAFFGAEPERRAVAESLSDKSAPIQTALAQMARDSGAFIVGGGFPEVSADPARPYNTSLVLNPQGEVVTAYRKLHLFDVEIPDGASYRESASTTAGKDVVVIDCFGFRVGITICYDLRFPELYRKLVDERVDVIAVTAAFTAHTGKDHWHVLLRARAIESQAYVIAAAQWGKHPQNRVTYGHSLLVDPWGTVIADASDQVSVVVGSVERAYLEQVRRNVPCLQHRKL